MCIDDCGDELLCCVCAPVAAILCCKLCKDRKDSTSVQEEPSTDFRQQPIDHMRTGDIYGASAYHQSQHAPQNHRMHNNHFPSHHGYPPNDLPSIHPSQQARSYK